MARIADHKPEDFKKLILKAGRRIVCEHGIKHLTARRIAKMVGYTPGTIYRYFDSMDVLVHAMNADTLEMLYERCSGVTAHDNPAETLIELARAFVAFARAHPREWEAVISYQYGAEHVWSDHYDEKVNRLLGLMSGATASLYAEPGSDKQIADMRLLWASLYGIFSLDAMHRLGKDVVLDDMIHNLVETYLMARQRS